MVHVELFYAIFAKTPVQRAQWLDRAVKAAVDWLPDFKLCSNTPPHEQVLLVVAGRAPTYLDAAMKVMKVFLSAFHTHLTPADVAMFTTRRYSTWFPLKPKSDWQQAVLAGSNSVL